MKEIFASAVFGVLKTVGHDPRGVEMPQVNVFGVVASDKEVEQSVAIVVKPHGSIRVNPLRQPGLLAHTRESVAVVIVIELRPAPFDEKEVFVAVVIVVAPDGAH